MKHLKSKELNSIPEEWEIVQLKDISSINLQSLPTSTDKSFEFWYIDLSSVKSGKMEFPKEKVRFENSSPRARRKVSYNDVLLATVRPNLLGYAIAKFDLDDIICSTGFAVITCRSEASSDFIYQSLYSKFFQLQIEKSIVGSNYPAINTSDVANFLIPLPPLPEQQKIAEILSMVDEKIDVIEAQITQTQELKKGLMQQLLTKGIGHTTFKDSPLGEIPESWEVVKLVDVSSKIGDGLHSTPKYVDSSNYFFINGNNLTNGRIVINEKTKCISEAEYSKYFRDIESGTILMSINGTIGNLAIYKGEKVILGKSAAYITCGPGVDKYYLFYFLQSSQARERFFEELTGTTISNLSLKSIRNLLLALPPIAEQYKIAEILKGFDIKLETLKQKNTYFKILKKGLMLQLLTGKIRVNTLIENEIPA